MNADEGEYAAVAAYGLVDLQDGLCLTVILRPFVC